MARDLSAVFHCPQLRLLSTTDLLGERAVGIETASRRWIGRICDLAAERLLEQQVALARDRLSDAVEERARVGGARAGEEDVGQSVLHDLPDIDHGNADAHMLLDVQV